MSTEKRVFKALFKKEINPVKLRKKKIALGLIDDLEYDYDYLRDEVGRLSYSVDEWFDQEFDKWYQAGSDLRSVYCQNSEAFIDPADVENDKNILIEIKAKADDLGIPVEDIFDNYDAYLEEINYLDELSERFEEQKRILSDSGMQGRDC